MEPQRAEEMLVDFIHLQIGQTGNLSFVHNVSFHSVCGLHSHNLQVTLLHFHS